MSDSEATRVPSSARVDPVEDDDENLASVVRIERHEDIASICGRVDTAPTYAVVVHAPGGNRALSREIGIRRLLKHAHESGRTIAIATSSIGLASRARQFNIPVARKPEHVRWDSGGRVVVRLGRGSILLPPLGRYTTALALLAVVALGVGLLFTMAPSATVIAFPPTETVERRVSVVASPEFTELDLATMSVPATTVSNTRIITLAVPTTGSITAGIETAQVTLTIYNNTDEEVTIPAGTIFVGEEGPDFEIREEVVVPAGLAPAVTAYAMEPGTVGNIPPVTITGFQSPEDFPEGIEVENHGDAGGGADGPVRAVDANDLSTIRQLAQDLAVVDAIKETLVEDRPHDAVFLETAEVSVVPGRPSDPPGSIADVLVMDVTVVVEALAVSGDVLDQVAGAVLSDGQQGEFIPGSVRAIETGARQFDQESRTIETELLLRGEFARDVSSGDIESAVRGKSVDGAQSTLAERYGIDDADVELSPGWAPRLPRFGFRIDVELRSRDTNSSPLLDEQQDDDAGATAAGP